MKQLRYYQEECLHSLINYFQKKPKGNPICVLPCGLGKALCIAEFFKRSLISWHSTRVMMLTHTWKLVEQNTDELIEQWPVAPVGLHAAEAGSRETMLPIIHGTVQSVCSTIKKAEEQDKYLPPQLRTFGWRDVLVIDECQGVGDADESQYIYVIKKLREINPNMVVIGYSATPFRVKMGYLTEGPIFDDICYDISGVERYNRLVVEGFISPLIPRPTENKIDTTGVKTTGGDFNEKEIEARADKITYQACQESVYLGWDRNYWMVFAAGIENCEKITATLQSLGIDAIACHSKIKPKENERRIEAYKAGEYRAIVGANKLAIGFNHRPIDLIVDLQPTMSPGKHGQKLGRGGRISPETNKRNCVVLDFSGNVPRCGPVNDLKVPNKKGNKTAPAPMKECPNCKMLNSAAARYCGGGKNEQEAMALGGCGHKFMFETKLLSTAGTDEIVRGSEAIIERFEVRSSFYGLHEKKGSPPMIKVSYITPGTKRFEEYVCLEHKGPASDKAKDWWRLRHKEEPPMTTYEALRRQKELRSPKWITVRLDNQYPEILSVEF